MRGASGLNSLLYLLWALGCLGTLSCTSQPPPCYDADDDERPDAPHLVRDDSGQCVRVESLDGGAESGSTDHARLLRLEVQPPATLAATFEPTKNTYAVAAPFLLTSLRITATAEDAMASVEVNGNAAPAGQTSLVELPVGESSIEVIVRKENLEPTTYSLSVTRAEAIDLANYFKASNTDAGDQFGSSVALDGDTLVAGAPSESSNATFAEDNQNDNQAVSSGAAYVFRRTSRGWEPEAYLKPNNTDAYDRFGASVAVEGDLLAVGAPDEDGSAREVNGDETSNTRTDSGAVYIYRRLGDVWEFDAYLKASNADSDDRFGHALALSQDRVVVGAPGESSSAQNVGGEQSDNQSDEQGAVYVFRLDASRWRQEAYLKASNGEQGDQFGQSVDIDKGVIAAGAWFEDSKALKDGGYYGDNSAESAGAAYVFRFTGNSWSEEGFVKAPNAETSDRFGGAVSVSGTALVVGAQGERSSARDVNGSQSNNESASSGAAYVYTYASTSWNFDSYLKASNTDNSDEFGAAVYVEGGFIAVGAPNEQGTATVVNGDDNNNELSAGAVYLFYRDAGNWKPHAYIKPPAVYNDGYFGSVLAIDRNGSLAVGHPNERGSSKGVDGPLEPANAPGSGAVFTFE